MICLANHMLVQVSGPFGGMAERLKAHVLKTCLGHTNVGSNPTPSAVGLHVRMFEGLLALVAHLPT